MRRSKLLFSSILATVLGMGVIGGVLTTENTRKVENVEAASGDATGRAYTFYCNWGAGTDSWTTKYVGYSTSTSGDSWTWQAMSQVSGSLWSANITNTNVKRLIFRHTQTYYKGCSTDALWTSDDNGIQNRFNITSRNPDADPGFYGSWAWETGYGYTVNYNSNGGSGTMSSHTMWIYSDSGGSTVHTNTFTRTGYSFTGWNTAADGSGTAVANGATLNYKNALSMVKNDSVTLYAQWTATTYTITYDRNNAGAQSATQTRTKQYDVAHTILNPTTFSWSPSTFKRFIGWADSREGNAAHYPGESYTTNAAKTYYYNEDWYNYQYKVNSGSWIDLIHNDEGKGQGIKVQFAPSTSQSLPLNGFLSFRYSADGKSTWTNIATNTITFEGNYNTTTGIQLETIDTIYLKITDSNTYTCWVPGISDRTIAVFNSSSATTGGTPYTMRGNGDNETVTTMDVPIEKGQFVRRGYDGNYTYGSYFAGGSGDAATCFSQIGESTAVECTKTGVYTVYNQKGSYSNWNDIWFTRNDEASAALLARKFNTIISAICTDIVSGTKTLSNLQAVWGNVSSSELYKHFNGQFTATLNYFKTSSTTTDADILACVARYDYIIKKYGTTALPDFIGRNNGYTANPQGAIKIALFGQSAESVGTTAIIIATAAISSASIAGYLLIRKKKQK